MARLWRLRTRKYFQSSLLIVGMLEKHILGSIIGLIFVVGLIAKI